MEHWRKRLILVVLLLLPKFVLALGLGNISLHSALYSPFNAEIGVVDATAATNLDTLKASLASTAEFQRVDLDRPAFLNQFTFTIAKDVSGKAFIKVTSKQPINEPYLSFLIKLTWPKGEVIREYTLLLDPPSYQKNDSSVNQPAKMSGASISQNIVSIQPSTLENNDLFGPIVGQQNLWYVAQQLQPRSTLTLRDIMLKLYKANPDVFVDGDINKLQKGSMLKIPTGIVTETSTSTKNSIQEVDQFQNPKPNSALNEKPITSVALQNESDNELLPKQQLQGTDAQKVEQLESELEITSQSFNTAKEANQLLKLQIEEFEAKNKELELKLADAMKQLGMFKQTTQSESSPASSNESDNIIGKLMSQVNFQIFFIAIIVAMIILVLLLRRKRGTTSTKNTVDDKLEKVLNESKHKKEMALKSDGDDAPEDKKSSTEVAVKIQQETGKVDGDPLAEAKVYINYGRYGQAENILKVALKANQENFDMWKLLLTVYAESFNMEAFDTCVEDMPDALLQNQQVEQEIANLRTDTWGDDVPKAKHTKLKNLKKSESKRTEESESDVRELDFDGEIDDHEFEDQDEDDFHVDEFEEDEEDEQDEQAGQVKADKEIALSEEYIDDDAREEQPELNQKVSATPIDNDEDSIQINIASEDDEGEETIDLGEQDADVLDKEDTAELDLDNEIHAEEKSAEKTKATDQDVETEFSTEDKVLTKEAKPAEKENAAEQDDDIELVLEDETFTKEAQPVKKSNDEPEAIELEVEDQATENTKKSSKKLPEASDVDTEYSESTVENSGATKLDLAHAYIDMGDHEAARKMLKSVIDESEEKLKNEAKQLLDKLRKDK